MAQHLLGRPRAAILRLHRPLALHAGLPVLQPRRAQLLQDDRRDHPTVQETRRTRPSGPDLVLRLGVLHLLLDHADLPPRRRTLPLHARRDRLVRPDRHRRHRHGSVVCKVHHPAIRAHVQLPVRPDGESHGHHCRYVLRQTQRRGAHHPGLHAGHGPANHPGREPCRHLRHRTEREEQSEHRVHAAHLYGTVDGDECRGKAVRARRLGCEWESQRRVHRPDFLDMSCQRTL